VRPTAKHLLVLALAAALVLPATALAAQPAASTTPTATAAKGATDKQCWKALIRDWYDGRIDKVYPVHCYQDALKHLPDDVRTYSDAYDVISRALADATRGQKKVDPNEPVPPPTATPISSTTTSQSSTTPLPTTTTTPGGSDGEPTAGGPIGGVLTGGDQGADSVPIPLLVLAGLAILLVAAGAAGLVARRLQQSRGRP
jgi:hypothetical protein